MSSPQSKGGAARARNLTSDQRREIALQAARARWERVGDKGELPVTSHRGPLRIGDIEVEAFRLRDGRRVISKKGMATALTLKSTGGNAFLRSMTRPGVRSEIDENLWSRIENPISFRIIDPDSTAESGAVARRS